MHAETVDLTAETAELLAVEASTAGESSSGEDCLIVIKGAELSRRFALDKDQVIIGRCSDCDLRLDRPEVSRQHCRLVRTGDRVLLQDLSSKNKTFVNNMAITEHLLYDGDQIRVGEVVLKYLKGQNLETKYHEELSDRANLDPLTGAYNRRFFWEFLGRELDRCARYGGELSLAILDIDHFKTTNDQHGHLAGDRVLKDLVQLIRTNLRQVDVLARYGGEEFVVVLPEVATPGALLCAEKIRSLVEGHSFFYHKVRIPVTISLGVGTLAPGLSSPADFVELVDSRLLEAKRSGRNRVVGG